MIDRKKGKVQIRWKGLESINSTAAIIEELLILNTHVVISKYHSSVKFLEMTHFQSRAEKNKVSPEQKSESSHVSRGKGWSEPEQAVIPENRAPSRSYRITMLRAGPSIPTMMLRTGLSLSVMMLRAGSSISMTTAKEERMSCLSLRYSCTSAQPQSCLVANGFYLGHDSIWQVRKKWQAENIIFCNPWAYQNGISG